MGYESISVDKTSPVFQSLVSQSQVSVPMFSFYFAESGSELYIGGANQNLYTGPFTYMPVTTPVGLDNNALGTVLKINIAGILARLVRQDFCQRGDCYMERRCHH
jgi:hypothetical protein